MKRCIRPMGRTSGSRLCGMSAEEVAELDLEVFIQMVTDVVRENNVVNFIRAAIKFVK